MVCTFCHFKNNLGLYYQQEAQLSQRGRATVSAVETLKCSLGVAQGHWKWYH